MIRRLLPPLLASLILAQPAILNAAPGTGPDLSPQYVQRSARCPVCGMYPYRTPQWTAQIVFNDQTASSFDSPLDLFRFLNNIALFDKQHKAADIGAIYVADYATKAWTDAPNLPAFATREAADAHAKAQGGKVLAFGEVTREVVKSLAGGHNH